MPKARYSYGGVGWGGVGRFRVGGGKQQQQTCRKDRGGRKRGPTRLRHTTNHVDANPEGTEKTRNK
jgi:hypothetical protein